MGRVHGARAWLTSSHGMGRVHESRERVHRVSAGVMHALFAGGTLAAVAEVAGLLGFLGNKGVWKPMIIAVDLHSCDAQSCDVHAFVCSHVMESRVMHSPLRFVSESVIVGVAGRLGR